MRALLGAASAFAAVALAAGCGTGGPAKSGADVGRGKQLFQSKCGACHVLADAGTSGKIGPDLDAAFAGDKAQGFKESTIRNVVLGQIRIAIPPMPRNLVRGSDAQAVAAYVASVAGEAGAAPAPAPAPTAGSPAAKGKSLYTSLGCQACHSLDGSKGIGPTFKGLFGAQAKLQGGQTVKADDAYLVESIRDPDKQIVDGFNPGVMSASVKPGQVSEADARAIVAFIKTLK